MARAAFLERAIAIVRALGWLVAFAVVGVAVTMVLIAMLRVRDEAGWGMAVSSGCAVVGFGFATWLVGHVLNRRSTAALGWGELRHLPARLAAGVGIGGLMAAGAVALSVILSGARLASDPATGFAAAALPLVVGLLGAALAEELMFRGYPLRRLADAVGPWVATALLAVGFAVAHGANPNVTAFGTVNIAVAAVWLAVAFFSRGAMPLAWGLHFGWNAGLALGFEAPVSGLTFDLPAVDYAAGRHAWIDGGAFGPEGGLVGTLAFGIGAVALLRIARWWRPAGGDA